MNHFIFILFFMSVTSFAAEKNTLQFPPNAAQLNRLKIEQVKEVPQPVLEPLSGRIAYDDNRTARITSPIEGKIVKLGAQVGDKVKVNQPLLWLDSPDYITAIADLHKAESDLRQKQLAFSRAKTLFEGQVLARKEFEIAQSNLDQAKVEVERTRLRLRTLNPSGKHDSLSDVENFILRSSIHGVITERQATVGSEARSDNPNPLFIVTDPEHLWVILEVEEKNLYKIKLNQLVNIEVEAYPNELFPAKVISIGETLDPTTRRIQVRCSIENIQHRLKPEMFAKITPSTSDAIKVIQIPNTALLTEGLYNFVFVETQPHTFEKRRVALILQGREYSFVKEGLIATNKIVTNGVLLLNTELASGVK
jgi:membrane fusion protein, heavy metal efflux system